MTFLERHFDKWRPDPNSECWLWFGAAGGRGVSWGYGQVNEKVDGKWKRVLAHRRSFEDAHGIILRDGDVVRHSCDTPACVNPDHLLVGTMKDNSQDSIARGRWNPGKGERHASNRLTEAQVREIRSSHRRGHRVIANMAEQYGVSKRTIHQIVARETWRWLE